MRKMMFIVAVLAMACMLALPTFAQDSTVFCGTLAAADCDLLKAAQTAMEESESGAVDISGSFVLQGIPDTPDITIGLGGSATYAIDTAALETLTAQFEGMDETNADAGQIVDGILGVLQAVNGTLVLNITLPADIAQQAGIASDTITLDMAFVNGTAYFNFDALDAATGGMLAAQNMTGIGGINVVEVAQLAIEQDPSFLEQMQSAMSMAMSSTTQSSTMTAEQMAFAEKYLTISRTDGGSGEAVFISTVDMAGLFADPEFMTAMQAQMAAQGNTMDDATFQQTMGIVQLLGDDMTMEIEQHIDPATSHTTYTGIKLNIDAATLLQLAGTPAEGDAVISFDLALTYSGFNSTTVEEPAGAQVADSAMVVQMLVGTMGAGQ